MDKASIKKLAALQLQLLVLRKALDDAQGMLELMASQPEAPAPRQRRNLRQARMVDVAADFNKYNRKG